MARKPTPIFAVALASISLVSPLCVHIFLPVLPALRQALGVSEAVAQATFSVALFGMSIATLVYGTLSDRLGRRSVLLAGLCLFLLGSLLALFAPNIEILILARLVQAVGAACGVTLVRTIARDAYGPERLVQALAYLTMFYTLGPMIAPIAGGVLVDAFGWRSVFAFSLAGGALITAVAWLVIYETKPAQAVTHPGSILNGYLQLFRSLRFCAFVFTTGFSTGAFMVTATTASYLMKDMLDRPATEFGLWFLAFPFGFFSGNFVSSRVGNRRAIESMVIVGATLTFVSALSQALLLGAGHVSPATIFIPGFFLTFSQGLSLPYAQAGAMAIEPRLAGTASGVAVCLQNFLGAATTQIYGLIADGTMSPIAYVACSSAFMTMVCGATPFLMKRRAA